MSKVIKGALIAAATAFVVITLGPLVGLNATALFASTSTLGGLSIAAQYAVAAFAGSLITGGVAMMTSRGIEATSQNFGTKLAGKGAQVPRNIIYGKARVGGTILKMSTSGTKNNKLHLAIALAGHEVESLEGVYFNDTLLTTSTATVGGKTYFKVTNAEFKNTDNEHEIDSNGTLVQFSFNDGSQTVVDPLAAQNLSSRYPSTAKFQGIAYVYMEIIYDPEKMPNIPAIHFLVKGKKVYDPRTSSTAWSDNPALIIRDYLKDTVYGLKAVDDEVNDTTGAGGFAAAANTCEQQVTLADGSSTEDRYTLNGFINASGRGDGILEGFLSSCAGKLTYTSGKFNLFVGASQTPTLTINDSDVLQAQQLSTKTGNGDLYNGVKAIFVDSTENYIGTEAPVLLNTTFLNEDTPSGEATANYKKVMETQLPFTVTHTMAQRIQKIQLLRQREAATLSVLTTLDFMKLQPADWVQVNNERFGFEDKIFEVLSVTMEFGENDGAIFAATRLTLQEVSASVYSYASNEYETPQTPASAPEGGDLSVGSPTAGSLTQRTRTEGPTAKIDIIVPWTNAVETALQGTEIQYKESGASTYDTVTSAGRGSTEIAIPNVQVGKTYDVRARHYSWDNVFGSFVSFSSITIAEPDTISAPSSVSATTDKPYFVSLAWTNPTNENFRAVEVHYSTSSGFTPSSGTLLNTYYGEPAKAKLVNLGIAQGLSYDTNYYFKIRSVNVYGSASSYTSQVTGQFKRATTTDVENLNASVITAGTIDASTITVTNINADNITAGTIGAARIDVSQLSAISADLGAITAGSVGGGSITIDGDSIHQGTGTFANANTDFFLGSNGKFSIQDKLQFDGTVSDPTLIIDGNIQSNQIVVGSGSTRAVMSSAGTARFWAGSENVTATTPFIVRSDGEVFARNLVLTDTNGNAYFNAQTGLTNLAISQIASQIGGKVTEYDDAVVGDDGKLKVTFEETGGSDVTFGCVFNVNFSGSASNASQSVAENNAISELPDNFSILIRISTDPDFDVAAGDGLFAASGTFTKSTDGSPSSTEYECEASSIFGEVSGTPDGFGYIASASVKKNQGAVDSSGFITLEGSRLAANGQAVAAGTYYVKAAISTTDTSYDTTNLVTSTSPRTLTVKDLTVGGGFIIGDAASQFVGEADITSVSITANNGITGTASVLAGPANFTLGLGNITPTTVTAGGLIESTTGGFKFPDGTTQTTASTGGGNVSSTGTPANNQLAVWTNATTIEGESELTWDGDNLTVNTAGAPTIIIDGVGPQAIQFRENGSRSGTPQIIHRTTPNTIGIEESFNGTQLFYYDIDDDFAYFKGDVGIGVVDPSSKLEVAGVLTVANAGGTDPNFIIQGDGEQTMRFYNTASTGSKRVSWKMANRTNTDWEFIMFTDVSGDGTESFKLQGRTSGNGLLIRDGAVKSEGQLHTVGNLGIGTTSPETSLHISSGAPVIRLEDTNAATDAKQWNIATSTANLLRFQALTDADQGGGSLFEFERSGNQITQFAGMKNGTRWFTIHNTDQKVGIGTTSPSLGDLTIDGGTLGTTTGDEVSYIGLQGLASTNVDKFRVTHRRTDDGTADWTDAAWRLQRTVDTDNMGFIQFGHFSDNNADTIMFGNGNTEAMRITPDGKVGIGTASPFVPLHVNGSIRANGFFNLQTTSNTAFVMNNTAGGNTRLRFEVSGTQKYSFGVNASNDSFTIYRAAGSAATVFFLENGAPNHAFRIAANGNLALGNDNPTDALSVATDDNTDSGASKSIRLGHTGDSARSAVLTKSRNFASDKGELKLEVSKGAAGSPLTIYNNVSNEALRLNEDGELGINEADPTSKLHVTETATGTYIVQFQADLGTNNNRSLRLKTPDTDSGSEPFTWQTGNSVAWQVDATEAMRLNSAGNLGIGTTSPASPLTVAGVIESTTGGVKFPDGTTQTTAASYYYSATSTDTTTNHNAGYTPTVVDFNSELLNQGSFSETDGRITVPVAGVYRIYGQVTFTRNSTEQRLSLQLQIFKNGTGESGRGRGSYVRGQGDVNDATAYIEDFISCSANDILDIRAFRDGVSGTSILNANQSRLLIQKI